jgi:hypothetical protein
MEVSMSIDTRNRGFHRIALATVAAIGLGALTLPWAPAKAQVYFGFGPGGFGVEVAPPAPYYYPPYPYYHRYYHHYYPRYYDGW